MEKLLWPLRLFSDDFKGNRSQVIRVNSINIRSEVWRQSFAR